MSDQPNSPSIDRRDFGRLAFGALAAAAAGSARSGTAAAAETPGIKLCVQSPAKPSDEQLLFLKQLGAQYVSVGSTPDLRTAEGFMEIKKRYGAAGITVWNIGNVSVHNMPEVTLNLPGRDQKIEEYKQYLRNLKLAGIRYSTYAHMGNGIWTSGRTEVRGASAREFDLNSPTARGESPVVQHDGVEASHHRRTDVPQHRRGDPRGTEGRGRRGWITADYEKVRGNDPFCRGRGELFSEALRRRRQIDRTFLACFVHRAALTNPGLGAQTGVVHDVY